MNNKTMIAAAALLLAGMAMPVNAYHVDPTVVGVVAPTIEGWIGEEDQLIICESNGPNDPVNIDVVAHEGFGGVCYAGPFNAGDAAVAAWPARPAEYAPGVACDIFDLVVVNAYDIVAGVPPAPHFTDAAPIPFTGRFGNQQDEFEYEGAKVNRQYLYWATNNAHATIFPAVIWWDAGVPDETTIAAFEVGNVPGTFGDVVWTAPTAAPDAAWVDVSEDDAGAPLEVVYRNVANPALFLI